MNGPAASFYVTGGTLRQDAPCYIERAALAHPLVASTLHHQHERKREPIRAEFSRAAHGLR